MEDTALSQRTVASGAVSPRGLCIVRYKTGGIGGAESYLKRLTDSLLQRGIGFKIIDSKSCSKSFLPFWLRLLLFSRYASALSDNCAVFSLERIAHPDIYRAGDGVHAEWLHIKSRYDSFFGSFFWFLKPLNLVYLYLERKTFKNTKLVIANSEMVKEQIASRFGVSADKIAVVYNGFDASKFDKIAAKKALAAKLGFDESKKIILFVGNGFFRKGAKQFIEIAAMLKSQDFVAIIVGRDKKMASYKALAAKLGIDEKLFFVGEQKDVFDYYAAADIFLFPTLYDPFANVVIEAMAHASAVITTKQNGAHEIVPQKELVMDTPTDFSVARKIDELLTSDELLQKMKVQNMQEAAKYSVERNLTQTLHLIEEFAG